MDKYKFASGTAREAAKAIQGSIDDYQKAISDLKRNTSSVTVGKAFKEGIMKEMNEALKNKSMEDGNRILEKIQAKTKEANVSTDTSNE